MAFLSGVKNEGVVLEQRQGVGGQVVQQRIAQTKRWMWPARTLLLPEDVGDVIGAERPSCGSFLNGSGYRLRPILSDQFQQFGKLSRQGTIAIGDFPQISFQDGRRTQSIQKREQSLLRTRPPGCRTKI